MWSTKKAIIYEVEKIVGKDRAVRLIFNVRSLITLVICLGNWTKDVLCIVTLILASGSCSNVRFDFQWLQDEEINILCMQWIQNSIDKEIDFYDLTGIELAVNHVRHPTIDKSWIETYEVDSLAHANALCKGERYKRIAESKQWEEGQTPRFAKSESKEKADNNWYEDAQPDPVLGPITQEAQILLRQF